MTDQIATLPPRTSDAASVQDALDPAAITALRSRLRGQLLRPSDPGYDDARSLWNAMIDRRPALVIRCLGVGDVIAAVEFVREHGLSLTIKGGGHNISGLAVADGAVMLDMSPMRGVRVDPAARLAWAQAGCLLGDVDRETQLHGLAAPLGFVSTTGIAGLTLGGGFGYLTRRFGWTCDNVVAFDVVTADARIVRATETEHPDLFWALRGGGGNFGVVTGFTYRLAPMGPEIVGGAIAWRAEEAPRILEAFRDAGRGVAARALRGGGTAQGATCALAVHRRSMGRTSWPSSSATRVRWPRASEAPGADQATGAARRGRGSAAPVPDRSSVSSTPPSRRAGDTTGNRSSSRDTRASFWTARDGTPSA